MLYWRSVSSFRSDARNELSSKKTTVSINRATLEAALLSQGKEARGMVKAMKETASHPTQSVCYSDLVFGGPGVLGVDVVRQRLVTAVTNSRKNRKWSCDDLDKRCGFGRTLQPRKIKLPRCAEFEKTPRLMTGFVFSLAARALKLKTDEVLDIKMSKKVQDYAIADMEQNRLGVRAGSGGGDVGKITRAQQAKIFVLFKILDEIR